jgi:hypothetical protein
MIFSVSQDTPVPESADHLNSSNIFALDGVSSPDDLRPNGLSYSIEHKLPGFSLPPADLNKLRIIHGSCRQPQGAGRDAFPNLGEIIGFDAPVADDRPHLLMEVQLSNTFCERTISVLELNRYAVETAP